MEQRHQQKEEPHPQMGPRLPQKVPHPQKGQRLPQKEQRLRPKVPHPRKEHRPQKEHRLRQWRGHLLRLRKAHRLPHPPKVPQPLPPQKVHRRLRPQHLRKAPPPPPRRHRQQKVCNNFQRVHDNLLLSRLIVSLYD
ncbi:uncharacterized protein LOC106131104 [Amyelois transitella]|uniref:uncharacterized protein LOC106131104 n=1 Tax=Amyelois transitella TaxID=680683 RepID=UPI0029905616|nr:uncharacterized protein LOC106131104 [Amyelois transitella]